jgi:hypothetical protein
MSLVKKLAVKLSEPHPKSRFFSYLSPLSAFVLVIAVFSSAIFAISTLSSPEAVAATKRQAITKYEFTMPKAYQPQGSNGGYDDYRCFLMDPKINLNSILTTIEFVPQVKEIVHHAILFRIPAKQVAQAKALDVNGDGWSCFGGSGIGSMFQSFVNTPWLSAWVPGRNRDFAPAGYGYPFNKGDQIVLQVHYNLLAAHSDHQMKDQSKIVLTGIPATGAKVKTLNYELLPAPVELACPAGIIGPLCDRKKSLIDLAARTSNISALEASGINLLCKQDPFNPKPSNTSTCDKVIRTPQLVVAAAPHMHLLGRSLKITANPGTASEAVLLDNQNYNFDDQSAKVLAKPFQLKAGDTVRVQCTFDPTLRQKLPVLKNLPAKYITWGEGSGDEMCLGVLITSKEIATK